MSNHKSRLADTYTLKEAIEKFLKVSPIKNQYQENALVSAWGEIMGLPVAEKPHEFTSKTKLYLYKSNPHPYATICR